MRPDYQNFQDLIFQLVETLHQELHQLQRLLKIMRRKKSLAEGAAGADGLRSIEKEILADMVTVERDRISLLTELGQILNHPTPSRLRVAELVLYACPEGRDELLDLREDFRDLADAFEAVSSVEPLFSRHSAGQIRLFLTSSRNDEERGAQRPEPGAGSRNVKRSNGSVARAGGDAA